MFVMYCFSTCYLCQHFYCCTTICTSISWSPFRVNPWWSLSCLWALRRWSFTFWETFLHSILLPSSWSKRTCDTHYYPKSTYLYGAEATWKSRSGLGSDCPPVQCLWSVPVKVHGRTHRNKDMRYDIVTRPSQFIIAQMINWKLLDQLLNVTPVVFKTILCCPLAPPLLGKGFTNCISMYWSLNF